MRKLFILFFFIFLISLISSAELSISPTQLDFNTITNQESCNQISIYTEKLGLLIGEDRWAEEGIVEKKFSLHNLSPSDLDLEVSYPKKLEVKNFTTMDICIIAKNAGLYHGLLLYKIESNNAGVGIWMTANVSKKEGMSISKLTGKAIAVKESDAGTILIILPIVLMIILGVLLLKLRKKREGVC